ncbi:hypothetical protein [Kibdelosporangium philippinense]|uniref:hypothetical protein n=1 Tax=Kibdelosporangium philippinense TaxID=211113 RepID=UPI0036202B0F
MPDPHGRGDLTSVTLAMRIGGWRVAGGLNGITRRSSSGATTRLAVAPTRLRGRTRCRRRSPH